MDVTATQTATSQSGATASATTGTVTATSDYETFLKMLTAQIQNQDPLNPMESTDFATQLATFSGVEQQVQTNELLKSMGAGSGLVGLADYAGWVGMDARVSGSADFGGTPLTLHAEMPQGAVRAELVVTSPDGIEVQRREITGESAPYVWDGIGTSGKALLPGTYELSIAAHMPSGRVETVDVATYARVTEIRAGTEGPQIVLAGGRSVGVGDVTALRAGN